MSTTTVSDDLQQLLDRNEELLWHGTPEWQPLRLRYLVMAVPLTVFALIFGTVLVALTTVAIANAYGVVAGVAAGSLIVGGTFALALIGTLKTARLRYDHAEYAVTNERLIEFGGTVGRDYSSIEWDSIQDVEVNVGLVDKFYDTGSIRAIAAGSLGSGVSFDYIPDPYATAEPIEEARRRKREALAQA